MNKLNFSSSRYIIIVMLVQIILLLVIFAGKEYGYLSDQFFLESLDFILVIVVILAIVSLYLVKKLFQVIDQRVQFEIQKMKLEEKEKMIKNLRSHKHDFSNHLQIIYAMVQLDKKEEIKEYIHSLNSDLTNLSFGEGEVLDSILDPVLVPKQKEAMEQGIELEYYLDEGLQEVENISLNRISRILFNLIDNAINAINDAKEEGKIRIRGRDYGAEYTISVYNTESFIAEDLIDKVLEPGVSTKGVDRGFGLYIIKSLIEEAGGSLEIESREDGKTTEFICNFVKN